MMAQKGYDLTGQSPTQITRDTLEVCGFVVLMGCALSVEDIPPGVIGQDWEFIDPVDADLESVWAISTEIEQHVIELFDDFPTQAARRTQNDR